MTTTADIVTAAAALDQLARDGQDIAEAATSLGAEARTHGDASRFVLGEIARTLTTHYGDATMGTWAKSVKVGVSSARHYRRVVEALGLTRCIEYLALDMTYSFMRTAVFKLGDEAAVEYLDTFANTPAGQEPPALPKTKNTPPETYLDITDALICDVNTADGTIRLSVGNGVYSVVNLPRDRQYRLVLKEAK